MAELGGLKFNAEHQRMLALALLLVLLLSVLGGVFLIWWRVYQHYDQAIERSRQSILLYHQRSINKPALQAEIEKLNRDIRTIGQLLPQEDEQTAGAALHEAVRKLVLDSSGDVSSSQLLSPREEGAFIAVSVRIEIVISMKNAETLFNKLYMATPVMFIDELVVKPDYSQPSYAPHNWQSGDMNLSLTVSAYLRNPHAILEEENEAQ